MKRSKKRVAVALGLGAVLALSPVLGPVGSAFAADATNDEAQEQTTKKMPEVETTTVTFHDADGEVIASYEKNLVGKGHLFKEFVADLVADYPNYAGMEWTLTVDGTGSAINGNDTVGSDLNVYIVSEPSTPATLYTVKFHDENGDFYRGVTKGGEHTLQEFIDDAYLSGLEKDGYTLHWVTSLDDPDGSEVLPTDTVLANLDLYAYYTEDPVDEPATLYTVTFHDANGDFYRGVTKGGEHTLQSYIDDAYLSGLEKDGYTLHWVTSLDDPDGSEVLPTDTVLANLDLYAYYTEDAAEEPVPDTYTVTFVDGIDSTEDQVITVNAGETVNPDDVITPSYDGYTFLGWYVDADFSAEFDFSTPITEDTTVYGGWQKNADTEVPGDDVEQPSAPSESENDSTTSTEEESKLPKTGDASLMVSGVLAAGAALSALGVAIRKRR